MYIRIEKCRALDESERASLARFGRAEQKRLENIKNAKHGEESAMGLYALAKLTNKAEFCPELARDENGRPYFARETGIDLNISHSDGVVVAALAYGGRIGVDIERIFDKDFSKKQKLAERFFLENEKKLLANSKEPVVDFYKIWTAKEAAAKCTGLGLSAALDLDTVSAEKEERFFFSRFFVRCDEERYLLSVASEAKNKLAEISAGSDIRFQIMEMKNEF